MTWIDNLIVAVYMIGVVAVGILYRGRQDTIRDYFTAREGFQGVFGQIMVGLSIAATFFSGLSFVVYPSIVYNHGVTVLSSLVCFPVAYLLLRGWFLPRYLAWRQESPYDFIELRFGRPARMLASAMFVLLRISWMAALIYAPVLVVMAAAGLGREWFWPLVLLIGISSTVYTVAGGIRGVIVTDALQFLVIVGTLAATIGCVLVRLPLSGLEVAGYMRSESGLLELNWSLNPALVITVWTMAVGGTVQNLGSFMADQMSLQRYLTAGDVRSASRAFATSALAMPLVLILLAMVGLMLGAWYRLHPDPGMPQSADRVFPYFVATQLPVGFTGLIIAAILASTMSSITSAVNTLSGSLIGDFVPLSSRLRPRVLLWLARALSAFLGVAATLIAGFVDRFSSLFDVMNIFLGVFIGPLFGCVLCAVSRVRLTGPAVIAGMLAGCVAGVAVAFSSIASPWVTPASGLATVLVAWVGSRLSAVRANAGTPDGQRAV